MKTASEIREEIAQLTRKGRPSASVEHPEAKEIRKRIAFLKQVLFYLESKPSESFAKTQLTKIRRKRDLIEAQVRTVSSWREKKELKKELGYSKLLFQINNLEFILH